MSRIITKCYTEFARLKNSMTILHYSVFINKITSQGTYVMTQDETKKFTRKFLTAFGIAGKDADESTINGVL